MKKTIIAVLAALMVSLFPHPADAGGYVYNAKGEKIYVGDYVPETPAEPADKPAAATGDNAVADQLQAIIQRFIASQYRNAAHLADIYAAHIIQAARTYNVDPLLLAALVAQESSYNPLAVSPAGAMGPAQLMPATALRLGVSNPYDIQQAVHAAAIYIAEMLIAFQGENQVALALAAYNAGPGAVRQYGGIPPYPETVDYIHQVARNYSLLCSQ